MANDEEEHTEIFDMPDDEDILDVDNSIELSVVPEDEEHMLEDEEDMVEVEEYIELPAIINLDQIQAWCRECHATHGKWCNDRYSEHLAKHLDSLTLVDTHTASLVDLPTSTPYVALSYVWGNIPMLKARKANLADLKKSGALVKYENDIPATIRDAMYLVKSLGERYLWVDCLCIVQDQEKEDMDRMLQAMAFIYASAEFTVVDASGSHAGHGLRGIGGSSQQREGNFVPRRDISSYGIDYPYSSNWASRGWTFQESLFSRRLLIFGTSVQWICGLELWCESKSYAEGANASQELSGAAVPLPATRSHLGIPMGYMSLISDMPDLGAWSVVISGYSPRNLTFETDVNRAVAGATEIFGSKFPGGILHGLPVFFFDIVLLWQPMHLPLERRVGQPSWSWIGWKGEVDPIQAWHRYYPGISKPYGSSKDWVPGAVMKPVASYQCSPEADSHFNEFYKYRNYRVDTSASLPPGWLRHYHSDGDYFTRTAQHDHVKYTYPLPIAEPPLLAQGRSPVLVCTGSYAILQLECFDRDPIGILKQSDRVVGAIFFHDNNVYAKAFHADCELIAISEVNFSTQKAAKIPLIMSGLLKPNSKANFESLADVNLDYYNIMCIGWEKDIAYRGGLGMVEKRAWLSFGATYKTFKLG